MTNSVSLAQPAFDLIVSSDHLTLVYFFNLLRLTEPLTVQALRLVTLT